MIEVYLLRQLAMFTEYGTLSRAAEDLHISQPALSRSMRRLEEDLGVPLFVRSSSKLTLNETGKVAAEGARLLLSQHDALERRILDFDRSLHTITLGSCAPYPILHIMPALQSCFGDMTITSELNSDEALLHGLKTRRYQLAILRDSVDGLFCQRYIDEQLYIAVPETHRLAARETVHFEDLAGESFLVQMNVGFWMDVCREHMPEKNLLLQADASALGELVEATDFPAFSSDRMIESGNAKVARVSIPIDEAEARVTYYVACLDAEKKRYNALLSTIRAKMLSGKE